MKTSITQIKMVCHLLPFAKVGQICKLSGKGREPENELKARNREAPTKSCEIIGQVYHQIAKVFYKMCLFMTPPSSLLSNHFT